MRVRALLTVAAASLLLAVVLVGPVTGSSGVGGPAEVVDADLSGVPAATDADGEPIVDDPADDPAHTARVQALRDTAGGAEHEGHGHGAWPLGAPGGVRSEAATAPIAFSMAGFTVPEGAGVSFRTRVAGGEWDTWHPVVVDPDEGPDPESAGGEGADGGAGDDAAVSEPVWVGEADELQLRVDGADPSEVEVHLVDSLGQNRGPLARLGDAAVGLARRVTSAGSPAAATVDQPDIVTRDEWGADESWRRGTPRTAERATTGVLHHTVTGNTYTRSEAPAVVRAIYRYHTHSNGWDDIGYNFLVDRFGTVYQGRAGGVTEPVVGAHAAGYNTGSVGVAFMGNHAGGAGTSLASAAEESAVGLLTWLFDVHHIDADTDGTLGDRSALPRLVGHGDLGSTSCPGGHVRDRLDAIRAAVVDGQTAMFTAPSWSGEQLSVGDDLDVRAGLDPAGEWEFVVHDEDGTPVHRDTGTGETATASWAPPVAGTYEWELRSPGRRAVAGDLGVMEEVAERIGGGGAVGGGVALSQLAFEADHRADRAVLARADVFADAMAGGPLAGSEGPLLLTPSDELDGAVADELDRVLADTATVYVLGGEAAIDEAVVDEVAALGDDWTVERLAGAERTETAARVADVVLDRGGGDTVMLARSAPDHINPWADALAGSAWGARTDVPVLLTPPDRLTNPPAAVLDDVARTIVLGGTSAISAEVADAVPGAERVAGSTRAGTATAIARSLWRRTEAAPGDAFVFGAGWDAAAWQRALAAAPLAAREGAPLLLTDADAVPGATGAYLRDLGYGPDRTGRGWVLERHPVIDDATWAELNLLLQ